MRSMDQFTPKYIAVYNELKKELSGGNLPPGSFLPTEKSLIERFGASRTTIRKAVSLLRDEGLIDSRQGQGTRVLPPKKVYPAEFGMQKSHQFDVSIASRYPSGGEKTTQSQGAVIDTVRAEDRLSDIFAIPAGTPLWRLQRTKLVDGRPFGYVVSFIPVSLCPSLIDFDGRIVNLYETLMKHFGIDVSYATEEVTAISAGFVESKVLDVRPGMPLLYSVRTAYADGKPVEYSESKFNSELYRIGITMRQPVDGEIR